MTAPASISRDWNAVRADFPILGKPARHGRALVYLDNAATTQKPRAVIDALVAYYERENANVHRGVHYLAEVATERYEGAREKVAAFLNAPSPRGIVWTRGTTEGINLVAHAWGRKFLRAGDTVVLTEMEHHSNLVPWQLLAASTGVALRFVPVREDFRLDPDAFHRLLERKPKLVAFTHMSNLLGTVNPVAEMCAAARRAGAVTVVDGAQSAPHLPVDVQALGCDFYALSGHKMLGPTGVGALYAREDLQEAMDPFLGGGDMINKVTYERATWAAIPHKFEAGTPNVGGAAGLGAAVDYLRAIGMDVVHARVDELAAVAERRLREVPGLKPYWGPGPRGAVFSFAVEGIHPHDLAHLADQDGIAIRAGHMCVQPLLRKYDRPALARASLYLYNTEAEIEALGASLERIGGRFRRATR
jgi:cysteine desulfurase/selenocysteine lyase